MKRRGFSEQTIHLINPLPKADAKEIIAVVATKWPDFVEACRPIQDPFSFLIEYSSGEEGEKMFLHPGMSHPFRASEAKTFLQVHMTEQGLVSIGDDEMDDPLKVIDVCIRGLTRARAFWDARGSQQVLKVRQNMGISKDDAPDHAATLWPYYFNEARKILIEQKLAAMRAERAKLESDDAKSEEPVVGAA